MSYRSPTAIASRAQDADALCELIVEMHNKNIILMGDFNYANINWNTLQSMPGATTDSVSFLDCIETNNLTQHVKDPTRGSNGLDLVITRDPDIVHEVEVLDSLADLSPYGYMDGRCQEEYCDAEGNAGLQ